MRHWFLLLLLAITVAVIAYLVAWIFTGNDRGLDPEEPDGRAVPLPGSRPLVESDVSTARFDTVARGYRMVQVDAALRRAAYDIGYKQELIDVLEAEVVALREGRAEDADALRHAREGALGGPATGSTTFAREEHTQDGADHDRLEDAAAFANTYPIALDEDDAARGDGDGDDANRAAVEPDVTASARAGRDIDAPGAVGPGETTVGQRAVSGR